MKKVKTFEQYHEVNERGRSYFTTEGTTISEKDAYTARDLKKAINGICCYDEVEMDKRELSITIEEKENYMSFYYDADYGDNGAWVGQFEDCCVGINEIVAMSLEEFIDEVYEWKEWFEYEYPEKYEEEDYEDDDDFYESEKVDEANPDGTISDDEDERRDMLEMEIYQQTETLINFLKEEAEAIGGPFRSPGIIADCVKQIKDAFRKNKIKL